MHARRLVALLLVLALGLAACGDDGGGDEGGGGAAPAGEIARTVQHAMGATDVPARPQRVVALDSSFLDAAVALGVTPVGATEPSAGAGMPPYLADALAGVDVVGLTDTPNVEAIAALRPDLILGAKVRHEALYPALSAIAPTVFTESSGTSWKDGLAVTADALSAEDEAEALLAAYEERAERVGRDIGADGSTLSIVRFLLPDQIRLYGPSTFSGTVLTDVGFDLGDRAWNQYSMLLVAAEQLATADADVVFATSYGGTTSPDFAAAFAPVRPLWDGIPAVAAGRAHWVEDDVWMLGIGLTGAGLILDDVEASLGR